MGFLQPFLEPIHALLRIFAGLLFAQHGLQKVFGMFGGPPEAPAAILWTAGPIELVGGLLVALGLYAGPAAFLCSGTMAFAYFLAHWPGGESGSFFPIANRGELAVLYCFVFLWIAARGSGIWSVDAARGRRPAGA
jgi:putative oxidoreductase